MNNIIKIVPLVVVLAFSLAACVSYEKTMTADNGKQYRCKQDGYGIIGVVLADSKHKECVDNANAKGYK